MYDPQGILRRKHSRFPDALNRLERTIDAQGNTTVYAYDDNDNLTEMTTPLHNSAQWTYDALDRLETSTDLRGSLTRYGYNVNDQLDTVTDALKHLTDYDYDGLGNLTRVSSPDTGLTEYTLYDEAGNVKSRTDARGQKTTFHYDALNRVKLIEYFDFAVEFGYDQGPNGIGRLTELADTAAITSWKYDAHGRVLQKTQQVDDLILLTHYHYDASGRLDSITYPSGQLIAFGYTNGQVTQISVDGAVLLRDIKYQPSGQRGPGSGAMACPTVE